MYYNEGVHTTQGMLNLLFVNVVLKKNLCQGREQLSCAKKAYFFFFLFGNEALHYLPLSLKLKYCTNRPLANLYENFRWPQRLVQTNQKEQPD